MNELPIACSLSATELASRRREIAELKDGALLARAAVPGGAQARFAGSAEVERALRRLIELEGECCPFLDFALEREGDELVLDVVAPAGAESVARELLG
jgi:MerR family transcriptional regulator, copper efflux regulator